jgi:hypothetical protein
MEDVFDCHTIDECKMYFRCNELIRRISKVKEAAFCGEILSLLTNAFSLNERSGVNLRGAFNTDNITYSTEPSQLVEDYIYELEDGEHSSDKVISNYGERHITYHNMSFNME